jgi:hypothetical protein
MWWTGGWFVMSTGNGYVIFADRAFNRLGSFHGPTPGGAYVMDADGRGRVREVGMVS